MTAAVPHPVESAKSVQVEQARHPRSRRLDSPIVDPLSDHFLNLDGKHLDRYNAPITLRELTKRFQWCVRGEASNAAYGNTHVARARRWYARLLDGDRALCRETSNCHVALLTTNGAPYDVESDRWVPPIDYACEVDASRRYVDACLRNTLGDRLVGWARVYGGTQNGVCHAHRVLYVEGEVSPEEFIPVLRKHLRHSDVATDRNRHVHVGVDAVAEMELAPIGELDRERGLVSPAARYVAGQVPLVGGLTAESHEMEHAAVMWAGPFNAVSVSSSLRDAALREREGRQE